ncbi:16S rRNA (cytidine(1402)-2'-O)-methyltransferase [Cohnella mopanensis]|uniref:16S rRNA (cytidine(1402)-2'-O)-methyltransferase n=1 Tax=Cohnella mopanensis TaxID=2911966 RepID=UPI001EF856F7|nr:16S rRNA (cytidine(1402)-2'-O)-methyltransferase [Cohnella mopanensis]
MEKATVQKSFAAREVPGTLYLVATPIGNLEDMTFRAIRTLKEVQLIAAEDTRQTRKLLTHYEIQNRLVSYHEHNRDASGPELIRMLLEGQHIALVSDAGIPAISDPGADLVRDAVAEGIPVVPIPGANAALSGLIISGLPTDRFLFVGFPPRDRKGLNKVLDSLAGETGTLLFYESPHRLKKTLTVIEERWSKRKMAIVRELTKRHEEVIRGTVTACLGQIEQVPPLGECCIIIEGTSSNEEGMTAGEAGIGQWWSPLTLAEHVAHYESRQLNRKEAMKSAATDRGLSRRDVYQALLGESDE